jgi:hypothetical protein
MTTMFERLREGLVWSYAAVSAAEEQRTKGQQWWEQERLRLKEESRGRLDDALRQMEERRAQRTDWVTKRSGWFRERVRAGLAGSGVVTSDQIASLQARIDALTVEVHELRAHSGLVSDGMAAEASGGPPDITPAS